MRIFSLSSSLSFSFLVLTACGAAPEGQNPGECGDGADNDGNGAFDCDDEGCSGSPDCEGGDDTATSQNAAPSGAAIAITPATPGEDDDLICSIVTEATDPNGDTVTYRYAWKVNGGDAGISGQTVSAAQTSGGESWTCTVTPSDGVLDGTASSASVTIEQGNRAPSAPTVSINPADPTDDDVLTCVIDGESVDPDGDAVTYSYAWSVDGAASGVTAAAVSPGATSPGEQWTCTVSASDGDRESAAASASVDIRAPSASCKDILDAGHSTGDGTYVVYPDGRTPESVTCDMSTASGGWTAIFIARTQSYYSDITIPYTVDSLALRSDASEAMIGFADASGLNIELWARFSMPAEWITSAPMLTHRGSVDTVARLSDGSLLMDTLYFGYSNFNGDSGPWIDGSYGRIGFHSEGAPLWAAWADEGGGSSGTYTGDFCNDGSQSYYSTSCAGSGRWFVIYVR